MPATATRPTVCLNMIVKNEAHVISRCLASARGLIDRWCIVDTGSTDATEAAIRRALDGVPGTLHSRPWKNFGHNRNEALALARDEGCDYLLFIDADELFESHAGFAWPALTADAYELTCHYGGTHYARRALIATRLPWRWVGVLHEYLDCGEPHAAEALVTPTVLIHHDGARAHDPTTYLKDIALLESALRDEPDNARYAFYLAQSYRDAGQTANAIEAYERRAAMGGWEEEVWYSRLQIAVLRERLGERAEQVSAAYLAAFNARPSRAEPLVELARYHRLRGEHGLAYLYARHASTMTMPADRLFIDKASYAWRALDELAISAFYVGTAQARADGAAAARRLLAERRAPASDIARIERNAAYYE